MAAPVIGALSVLLACQLAGEVVTRAFEWPVPGPVLGLLGLLALLKLRDVAPAFVPDPVVNGGVEQVGKVFLQHLSLLFVPAGVGVVGRLDVLGQNGVALAVALVLSTLAGILVSVAVFRLVARLTGEAAGKLAGDGAGEPE